MNSRSGFTFVELMLVIVVSATLVSVAIPSFVDFRREGNITSSRAFASNLRSAVLAKKTQAALQCDRQLAEANPTIESVRAGDITAGGDCTAEQITDANARKFLDGGSTFTIPRNPANGLDTIVECSCTDICDAACQGIGGYCYNRTAMLIWAPGLEPSCGEISYFSSSNASGEGASSSEGSSGSETSSEESSSDESCGDEGTNYAIAYDEDSSMDQCFAYATFCGVTTPSVVDASYCEEGGGSSSSAESSDGGLSISCTIYEHDIEGQESSDGFLLSGSCTPDVLVTDEGGYNTNPCASGSYRMHFGTEYSEQLVTLFQGGEQASTTCPAFVSSSSSEDHGDPSVTVDVCNYLSGETDTTDLAGTCSNEGETVEILGVGGGSTTCSGGAWSVQVGYILPTGVSIMSGAATASISMETCTDLAGGGSSSSEIECTAHTENAPEYSWDDESHNCHIIYHYNECPDNPTDDDSTINQCDLGLTACGDSNGNGWDDCNGEYLGVGSSSSTPIVYCDSSPSYAYNDDDISCTQTMTYDSLDRECTPVDSIVAVSLCTSNIAACSADANSNSKDDCNGLAIVLGCTDAGANNFNASANLDDGSCTFDVYSVTASCMNWFPSGIVRITGNCLKNGSAMAGQSYSVDPATGSTLSANCNGSGFLDVSFSRTSYVGPYEVSSGGGASITVTCP